MPDTNQLPERLRKAITEIRRKPYPISDLIPLLSAAADALQARAQVQGDPSWWMRETDEGAEWTDTAPLVLSGWTPLYTAPQPAQVLGEPATVAVDHFDNGPFEAYTNRIYPHVEIGTKLYTAPQPAQAPQAEVTDAALSERARIVDLIEGRACKHNGPHLLTLELNQLADVIKSGLGWAEYERYKLQGITAQAKKEGA